MRTLVAAAAVMAATHVSAQQPSVEVASVRVSRSAEGGYATFRPGMVRIAATPLRTILVQAFGLHFGQANVRLDRERIDRRLLGTAFDIQANGAGDPAAMLREVLKDRFGLKWHTDTRNVPILALRAGPFAAGLKPSNVNCSKVMAPMPVPSECRNGVRDNAILYRSSGTMADLARSLQQFATVPIVDHTGLTGHFAWEYSLPLVPVSDALNELTRVEVKKQLGLSLEYSRGPWEVIVIDHIQMPTPN